MYTQSIREHWGRDRGGHALTSAAARTDHQRQRRTTHVVTLVIIGKRDRDQTISSCSPHSEQGSQLHRIQKTTENIRVSDGLRRIVTF